MSNQECSSSPNLLNSEGFQFFLQSCPETVLQLLTFFTCCLELYKGLLHLLHLIYIHLLLFQLKAQVQTIARWKEREQDQLCRFLPPNPALCLDLFLSSSKRVNYKVFHDEQQTALNLSHKECDKGQELGAPFKTLPPSPYLFLVVESKTHSTDGNNSTWQAPKIPILDVLKFALHFKLQYSEGRYILIWSLQQRNAKKKKKKGTFSREKGLIWHGKEAHTPLHVHVFSPSERKRVVNC